MDKNIFAIVANNIRTVKVKFQQLAKDTREFGWHSHLYTYVTNLNLQVGDLVVVAVGNNPEQAAFKVAMVWEIDENANIAPNSDIAYKYVMGYVNTEDYENLMQQKKEVEAELAKAYQTNIRKQFAQQFLGGASAELLAKLGYEKEE